MGLRAAVGEGCGEPAVSGAPAAAFGFGLGLRLGFRRCFQPMTTPVTDIKAIKVLETIKDGRSVWKHPTEAVSP